MIFDWLDIREGLYYSRELFFDQFFKSCIVNGDPGILFQKRCKVDCSCFNGDKLSALLINEVEREFYSRVKFIAEKV